MSLLRQADLSMNAKTDKQEVHSLMLVTKSAIIGDDIAGFVISSEESTPIKTESTSAEALKPVSTVKTTAKQSMYQNTAEAEEQPEEQSVNPSRDETFRPP